MDKTFLKKILFLAFSLAFCSLVYSQDIPASTEDNSSSTEANEAKAENSVEDKNSQTTENDKEKAIETAPKINTSDFGFYFGPELLLSETTVNSTQISNLGVSTNIGLEYEFKPIKYFSFLPSLDVSIFHYDFIGTDSNGRAYISEIENRTALSVAILLDIPVMARFDINSWVISLGGGIALFMRGAFLEPGVDPNELNSLGLSAKESVKLVNSYFWKKGRFFYPSLAFKFEHIFKSGWKAGLKFKALIPIYNVWDSTNTNFADSHIFQISVILHPAKN